MSNISFIIEIQPTTLNETLNLKNYSINSCMDLCNHVIHYSVGNTLFMMFFGFLALFLMQYTFLHSNKLQPYAKMISGINIILAIGMIIATFTLHR